MSVPVEEPGPGPEADGDARGPRLDSWKSIASHLGRDVRTVQRWEAREGLPVRRLQHSKSGSVFAYAAELNAWRDARDPRAEDAAVVPAAAAARRLGWRGWSAFGVLAVLVALAVGVAIGRPWRPPEAGTGLPPLRSVAVLPLTDLSGGRESAYFVDGMTEALIAHLSTSDLRVIARTSVMQFRGSRASAGEIARALNVDALIEGAVLRAGDRVRVTARLVRGDTQQTVWSGTYDRQLPDVLALQSEVAGAILREVKAAVAPAVPRQPAAARRVAADVYDAYLQARFALNKRNRTQADVQESIRLFEAVTARDAGFAQAHAGLAAAYQASGATSVGVLPVVETIPKAAEAARRALAIDPALAEAHSILAQADEQAWRWADAEAHYRSAIAVDPNDANATLGLGAHLLYQGRIDDGLALARRGRELDPLWPDRTVRLAWLLYQARRYDEAIRELRTVLAGEPDHGHALWYLGFALIEAGQFDEAVQTAERTAAVWKRSPASLALLARAYARAGRRADAAAVVAELAALGREGYVPPAVFVQAYVGTGDHERGIEALERAFREHSNIVRFLKTHPLFDPIRDDPRFTALVRRVGLA